MAAIVRCLENDFPVWENHILTQFHLAYLYLLEKSLYPYVKYKCFYVF